MVEAVKPAPEEDKKQTRTRYDHLRKIEIAQQKIYAEENTYHRQAREGYETSSVADKNKEKYLITFPYPYMNGYLHLGHAYSLSKCEFTARFQTQIGKNVLFPFSFHCTGMPIAASARRLKREIENGNTRTVQPDPKDKEAEKVPPSQYEILMQIGISESDIPAFQDPLHWLRYFPPHAQNDLKDLGIATDWRRSFITTKENPFYNAFVEWQFKRLKDSGKIKFGKRPTIYSELDGQPCADHDRSKGEGFGPQEYTLIKIEMLELPESLKQFEGKKVFMPAATLRPETMYGQTNCYVLPDGEYGAFEMTNDEIFVCSERSARNMAYQDLTKEPKKCPKLATVKG
jgi:leucyl-tRNA synthetase